MRAEIQQRIKFLLALIAMKSFVFLFVLFHVVDICIVVVSSAPLGDGFLRTPMRFEFDEGENATLTWKFRLANGDTWTKVQEVILGKWKEPGFLKTKLAIITPTGKCFRRWKRFSCLAQKRHDLEVGFIIANLTSNDEKTEFGIQIERGLDRNPLIDTFRFKIRRDKNTKTTIVSNFCMKNTGTYDSSISSDTRLYTDTCYI